MASLPAPKNILIDIVNTVLDSLIQGLGADAAIASATAAAPWLGLPIISWIFKGIVSSVASSLDENIKKFIDVQVIRFQNSEKKKEYDKAIDVIKSQGAGVTIDQINEAKLYINGLIHRGD